jgi:hypothetical protein
MTKLTHLVYVCKALAVGLAFFASAPAARANVYATDIKVNGSLYGVTNSTSSPVTISYHLNQAATLGCTVLILSDGATVATIDGGTNMGLNTVMWGETNDAGALVPGGTFSISITASAADLSDGTTNWVQITSDSTNTIVNYPLGIDVDKNTNSPYYGRVVVGNATDGVTNFDDVDGVTYSASLSCGLYKFNADTTPADEGAFGYANYTTNDNGDLSVGEMSTNGQDYHTNSTPGIIRIGGDDRIYFVDGSGTGAVVATDMEATTNQMVICAGPGGLTNGLESSIGYPNCLNSYANCPSGGMLNGGWGLGFLEFDVAGFDTGHSAIYLGDFQDLPNAGVWMWHLVNGASDPNDTMGTQAVAIGTNYGVADEIAIIPAGFSVDDNLDIVISQVPTYPFQYIYRGLPPINSCFEWTNWNGGVLPPGARGGAFAEATNAAWAAGSNVFYIDGANDTVINSRSHPTMVAMAAIFSSFPYATSGIGFAGIGVLNATNGSLIYNIDEANLYTSAAFDAVGNVYGCSTTANNWSAFSPPGASTNTTFAVATITITAPISPVITSISLVGGTVTIAFSDATDSPASAYTLQTASVLPGPWTAVLGASASGSSGTYSISTTTSGAAEFYRISR